MNYGWFLDGIYKCWIFFRYVFIVLVVAFVLGGINDLFVDLYYWGRQLYRQIFKKKLIKPLTLDQLLKVEEKPVAGDPLDSTCRHASRCYQKYAS
jgi:hypothetical protein